MSGLRRSIHFLVISLAGILAVAGLTYCGLATHANQPAMGYSYLLVVVLSAMFAGFWEATLTSLFAVTCLNYFFIPPVFTFVVADPANWVALGAFEATALIVSRLSAKARDRARAEQRQRRSMERLYDMSRRILFLDRRQTVAPQIVCLIRDVIRADAAVLFDATATRMDAAEPGTLELEQLARNAYLQDARRDDEGRAVFQRPLRLGTDLLGGLALSGGEVDSLTADAVASLTAVALERARSFEKESRAEAARESEQLRSAVLDSLAHAFKTPLTAIRTASSGLIEFGKLDPEGAELALLIDEQSKHLDRLTSDLLQMARIDVAQVKINREHVPASVLIEEILAKHRDEFRGHQFEISMPPEEPIAYGDPALLATALLQLIDNAAKYSTPGSTITIHVEENDAEVVFAIRNEGQPIRPADRERIFERFYRAPDSKHRAAGTGLGLSIARKTAEAHHGRLWFQSDDERGTTFYFAVPKAARRNHEPAAR